MTFTTGADVLLAKNSKDMSGTEITLMLQSQDVVWYC